MKSLSNQRGVTLIEIVVVLAVSALLMAGVLANRSAQSEATRFAGTIDSIKLILDDQQNQAQRSVLQPGGANYGKSRVGVYGKIIEFNPAVSRTSFTSSTLVVNNDGTGGLTKCDPQTHNIPNGAEFAGGQRQAIIFTKSPAQVFMAPSPYVDAPVPPVATCDRTTPYTNPVGPIPATPPPNPQNSNVRNQSNYDANNRNASFWTAGTVQFNQPGSTKTAEIIITPISNTIERRIIND